MDNAFKNVSKIAVFTILLVIVALETLVVLRSLQWLTYKVAAYSLLAFIVLYLITPLRGKGEIFNVCQGIIVLVVTVFISAHTIAVWSAPHPLLNIVVAPFTLLLEKMNSDIIKPVLEVDWGQVALSLIALRLLVYFADKIKSM